MMRMPDGSLLPFPVQQRRDQVANEEPTEGAGHVIPLHPDTDNPFELTIPDPTIVDAGGPALVLDHPEGPLATAYTWRK